MRMLVRQHKYYSNLTYIDHTEDQNQEQYNDNDYGYFCELDIVDNNKDIEEAIQKNVTNYNKYYVYNYNYNYNDPKKNDDIDHVKEINETNEINELIDKYNDIYFLIQFCLITSTGCILLYFTLK